MHFRLNRFRLNRTITFVHPFTGFDFLVKPETFFEEPIYIRSLIVNGKKFYKKNNQNQRLPLGREKKPLFDGTNV